MRKEILNKINSSPSDQINLGEMDIQNSELEEITNSLIEKKPNLKAIFLASNNISDEGANILTKGLVHLKQLEFLDLQFNYITKEGAENIFSLLSNHPKLQIAFHGNGIIDEGQMEAIKHNAMKR